MIQTLWSDSLGGGTVERASVTLDKSNGQVTALLHPELRNIAELRMTRERRDYTLQPTALVNEFFIRLARNPDFQWRNRAQFFSSVRQV